MAGLLRETVLCILLGLYLVHGARRIDVKKRMTVGLEEWRARRSELDTSPDAQDVLGLEEGEGLEPSDTLNRNGMQKTKYKETYKGVEVEGETVVIEKDGSGEFTGEVTGQLVEGIDEDLPSVDPQISAQDALNTALKREHDDADNIIFDEERDAKLVIRTEETSDPDEVELFLVWEINYRVKNKPSRPFYVIDAINGKVVDNWQGIDNSPARAIKRNHPVSNDVKEYLRAVRDLPKPNDNYQFPRYNPDEDPDCVEGYTKIGGIGGNVKNGMTVYGRDYPLLLVKKVDDVCRMENEYVVVIDYRDSATDYYSYWLYDSSGETPDNTTEPPYYYTEAPPYESLAHVVDCEYGNDDEVNGGYSPLNDVYHFSNEVKRMYNEWLNVEPLKNMTIQARVHYPMDNAFWDGRQITFGDGQSWFHPLTSMDIVAHELGHGFTEHHSGLIYSGESGGMNEAFSDIAGEAAEFFIGGNDWYIGKGIMMDRIALRFMDMPSKDNKSIGNSADYCPGIDVHYSSGVFNRAFYILSNQPGWGIRKAFEAFATANMLYWTPRCNFPEGACGVVKAASDLGYDEYQVVESFRSVGVEPCRKRRQGHLAMSNLNGRAGGNVTFLWSVDDDVSDAQITVTSNSWWDSSDVDLYVRSKAYSLESTEVGSPNEKILIPDPVPGPHIITINGRENFTQISLSVMSSPRVILSNLTSVQNIWPNIFQRPIEITQDLISSRASIAIRITRSDPDANYPWDMYLRYGEKVDMENYIYDHYGRSHYNEDTYEWEYTEITFCRAKPGTWYLGLTGTFSTIDVNIVTVHYPLKLQEPGEHEVPGQTCW